MKVWPVQNAKARVSELLDTGIAEGPQLLTRHGTEIAVLLPMHEWRRLQHSAPLSIKPLPLSDEAREDLPMPARGASRRRLPALLG